MFVSANFFKDPSRIGTGIRYISHREESLPEGTTRPLYGIGPRYRALQGDEAALVRLLHEDARGLKEPHYFRIKMTVDDTIARRLMALPWKSREWAVRDAVEKTFRGAYRYAQGVFVVHYHGGKARPFGHPHAHVNLSPRYQDGSAVAFIPRPRLAELKDRWAREIELAVTRHERRTLAPERLSPSRTPKRRRTRMPTLTEILVRTALSRSLGRPAGALLKVDGEVRSVARKPSRLGARLGLRLFDAVAPAPIRAGVGLARALASLRSRNQGGTHER